ncbi:MAG TPA: glycosyl hydrolase, partial [Niabella sp.]|nr:glycosyl hydrolase [Niabella sp.]
MRYLIKFWLVVSIGGLFVFPLSAKGQPVLADQVRQGFYSVPDSVQTSVYWYWISDHLSKDGVIEDLKAMKKAGINRAFIGNIFIKEIPRGKVRIFSDEWWEILHTALKTAGDLGIEIGIFNSPGWSQSGGPWVKPTQSMRYLAAKDTVIEGPFEGKLLLPAATGDFTDVRVVAFKLPSDAETTLSNKYPVITSSVRGKEVKAVMDGDRETAVTLSGGDTTTTFVFSVKEAFTARSIAIYPELNKASKMTVTLEAGDGVVFKPVKSFEMDRINNRLNVGFEQFAPV